mgnify:CR=1 FL=1
MNMRKSIPFLLVTILLMQSILSLTVDNVEATSGRGGSSDDFLVAEIDVNSSEANHWIQPDGSVVVYIAKGDMVDVSVEVKRGGNALQGSTAEVTVEMVHPIGYVMNSTSWQTVPMLGGQSYTDTFNWEAFVAHSYLDVTTNELSGGVIIRASVYNSADDRNDNDILEYTLPEPCRKIIWMQKVILVTKHSQPLRFQHSMVENTHLMVAMLMESGFGKQIIPLLRSGLQTGGMRTQVQIILQHHVAV